MTETIDNVPTWSKLSADHKFKLNFLDTISPLCSCGSDIETTVSISSTVQTF